MFKPIGFYLKRLDGLITAAFDEVLAGHGLRRRHWQVLTTLAERPGAPGELAARLAPFWTEEDVSFASVLDDLIGRGLVTVADLVEITETGRATQKELEVGVDGFRARMMTGLDREDYEKCVAALDRMCANLT
ncbi:hypothetical protein Afil01_17650 [Actinorhabdospora filicis]|uniref:MarR family transcriptional regulator n=1 Tax=Actinorhabdospora filicis TaxID=1785913 RepID=A0A9W6W8G8_9ACTN|nr:winged helix DNA-binding protein [Actinorhabdospora filicis]GLZ76958.1 hypothetical protein Afil01_17650 [Actinorhabdospora filicis]